MFRSGSPGNEAFSSTAGLKANVLLEALRRLGLKSTGLARAQVGPIYPAQVAQDRRGGHPKYQAGTDLVLQRLSAQGPFKVLLGLVLRLTFRWCWPRHLLKNGDHAYGASQRRKNTQIPAISLAPRPQTIVPRALPRSSDESSQSG